MAWHQKVLDQLTANPVGGYIFGAAPASEPTALSCGALLSAQRMEPALTAGEWLLDLQQSTGEIGISKEQDSPRWPTSWAILAWMGLFDATKESRFAEASERAIRRLLDIEGARSERIKEIGHDTTLLAWPWVEGTHAWLEPTALAVMAMKRMGRSDHERTHEAIAVLLDRQFPKGGCNYGNTFILQQELEPHVQPTGIVLMSLCDERALSRIATSVTWLEHAWPDALGIPSIGYAAQALAAFNRVPDDLDAVLEREWSRLNGQGANAMSTHKLALLALARFRATTNILLPTAWVTPAKDLGNKKAHA